MGQGMMLLESLMKLMFTVLQVWYYLLYEQLITGLSPLLLCVLESVMM